MAKLLEVEVKPQRGSRVHSQISCLRNVDRSEPPWTPLVLAHLRNARLGPLCDVSTLAERRRSSRSSFNAYSVVSIHDWLMFGLLPAGCHANPSPASAFLFRSPRDLACARLGVDRLHHSLRDRVLRIGSWSSRVCQPQITRRPLPPMDRRLLSPRLCQNQSNCSLKRRSLTPQIPPHFRETAPDVALRAAVEEKFEIDRSMGDDDDPVQVGSDGIVVVVPLVRNSGVLAATKSDAKAFEPPICTAPCELSACIVSRRFSRLR
jgi:hypothetical protein